MPAAVTLKTVLLPASTVWLCGCKVMLGGTSTVKVATVLVTLLPLLLMRTVYAPAFVVCALVMVNVALVAQDNTVFVLKHHCYAKGAVPSASTLNEALLP